MSDTYERILKAARAARRWALRHRRHGEFPPCLTGMCAIVAARLLEELTAVGLSTCACVVDTEDLGGHCYVECEGHLIDVTASQFGLRAVEVHHLSVCPEKVFWAATYRVGSAGELHALLEQLDWPEEQLPWVSAL